MAVALLGGFGPGLLATVLAGLAAAYWVLPPAEFAVEAPADRVGLVIFTGMGVFMSVVADLYRRHRHKAAAYDREAALRESQARLATFAEATFEGIVESEAGRIVDCNEQLARMLGYSVAELKGVEIASLIAPEDRDRVMASIRQGQESSSEHAMLRKDGTRIVVEAHGRPVSPGSARRHTAIRDITERKRAEEALDASRVAAFNLMEDALQARNQAERVSAELHQVNERLRLTERLVQFTGDAVYTYARENGRILFANQGFMDVMGLEGSPSDVIGRGIGDLLIYTEEPGTIRKVLDEQGSLRNYEYRFKTLKGDERCVLHNSTMVADPKTGDRVVEAIVKDITARKRQEEELRRLNRTLKALGDSDQAMMRAADEAAYLQEVCRIVVEDCGHPMVWVGYAEPDAGKSIRVVAFAGFEEGYLETLKLSWDDTERGRGPTGACIRTGQVRECRNMLTDPAFLPWRDEAQKRGYASSIALPLISEGRAFGSLTIYFKEPDACSAEEVKLLTELAGDLTYGIEAIRLRAARAQAERELRKTAEDLARSNRDLEQFAYVTSHDLKEPLRMVTGFTGLLKERYQDQLDAKAGEYIGFASDAAARMQQMVDDLLAYARVGRDSDVGPTDVAAVWTGRSETCK